MQLDEPVSISALQHYSYCPRQCALIHIEQTFDENLYTLRGQAVHANVDSPDSTIEDGVRVERSLPLYSNRLGLIGKADVVEFDEDGNPFPVEYKHGPRRQHEHDDIQLAAQAICLEEMLGLTVKAGAIYHHSSRKRRIVKLTDELRDRVLRVTEEVRLLLRDRLMPPPVNDERCKNCSLFDACQPAMIADKIGQLRLYEELFSDTED